MKLFVSVLALFAASAAFAAVPTLKAGTYCGSIQYGSFERMYEISVDSKTNTATCFTQSTGQAKSPCQYISDSKLANWDANLKYTVTDTSVNFPNVGDFSFTPRNNQLTLDDYQVTIKFYYTGDNACW